MKTETIAYRDDNLDVTLVVSAATVHIGMVRTRLQQEAIAAAEQDVDRYILRTYIWPALFASTVEARGIPWPLTFEQFLELPEPLEVEWERAAFALNPHWQVAIEEEDVGGESDVKKKATSSTDG